MTITRENSQAYTDLAPRLSVLVPFYRDDATALLRALDAQTRGLAIEILFYDDGTQDGSLTARISPLLRRKPATFYLAASRSRIKPKTLIETCTAPCRRSRIA